MLTRKIQNLLTWVSLRLEDQVQGVEGQRVPRKKKTRSDQSTNCL